VSLCVCIYIYIYARYLCFYVQGVDFDAYIYISKCLHVYVQGVDFDAFCALGHIKFCLCVHVYACVWL
jgi:hypothetical protein